MKESAHIAHIIEKLSVGDRVTLGQMITKIESNLDVDRNFSLDLLDQLPATPEQSIRIAVSGAPGVGKSTFIEALGMHLIKDGHRVAVLAIDPSSQISRGSIMGDKTRMPMLSSDPRAFVRPSAAGTTLGGVAERTRESIQLCEAAGYNVIFIETVGVGQSEYAAFNMVDFFLLLMQPGAGDSLQGIKRGIVEMADLVVVNKVDGDRIKMGKETLLQYKAALHLFPSRRGDWHPKVLTASALEKGGLAEIREQVNEFIRIQKESGRWQVERSKQKEIWLQDRTREWIERSILDHPEIKLALDTLMNKVQAEEISVSRAIHQMKETIRQLINP